MAPAPGRYDLHPVVRGIAAGALRSEERDGYGQRVVDHFSAQAQSPYHEAETLDDLRFGLHIIRTLLKMGRYQQACDAFSPELARALAFNLEANAEILTLMRPFFDRGWAVLPRSVSPAVRPYLANIAAIALAALDDVGDSSAALGAAIAADLQSKSWQNACVFIQNTSETLRMQNRLAQEDRCLEANLTLATLSEDKEVTFGARLYRFQQLAHIGQWAHAQAIWDLLDPMGRDWSRVSYRPGHAESDFALFRFWQGDLSEEHLIRGEQLAQKGRNRITVRRLHSLRGEWRLERGEWALAAASLLEAVSMAHAVRQADERAETQVALARFHLGLLADPRRDAEQLAKTRRPFHRALGNLWLAIGDREQATRHALAAYKWAWADGEPYVRRYELNKAHALLKELGVEVPDLPPYDAARDEKLPWEDAIAVAIENLRAEMEAKKREQN